MNRSVIWTISVALGALISLSACFEEEFTTSGDAKLGFSTDTLRFDTVFTELGSATRSFRVYNDDDLPLKIAKVYFDSEQTFFRMNVDGLPGPLVEEVEVGVKDSIWIFVEVTIDPDQPLSSSPFIIEDYIYFETNGNTQQVLLEAWGQNANYIPNRFHNNRISILTCGLGEEVWDDPKPYVIYGTLLIDSCTLIWPAGAQIYVHGGLADNELGVYNDGIIYTLPRGRLRSEGTVDEPVTVFDDRLESDYEGLWGGIRLGPLSGPHRLNHTVVRNAVTAVSVDSLATLVMDNTVLASTAGSGLFARHATVTARNCLFYDNGASGVALTFGGDYALDYCTIASFGNDGEGLTLNNYFCYDPLCEQGVFVNPLDVRLRNCIAVGSAADEIALIDVTKDNPNGSFTVLLENCIVRVDELLQVDNYPDFFENWCFGCSEWSFADTLFRDIGDFDYHLDSLSMAEGRAIPLAGVMTDLDGEARDPVMPDIGCYEYVPE